MAGAQCIKSCRYGSNIRIGKKSDLRDFNPGMVVGTRWVGLGSETADLIGISHPVVPGVYAEFWEKQKTLSERWFCGWKHLVDKRFQR